jgi:putative ABC transport system substrate-binding protein
MILGRAFSAISPSNSKRMKKILLSLIFLFTAVFASFSEEYSVVILTNKGVKQYDQAIAGFKDLMTSKNIQINYTTFDDNDSQRNEEILTQITDLKPQLIFTVGTEKTLLVKDRITDIPIIFSMVLDPVEGGIVSSFDASGKNITGVSLKISTQTQFDKLKQILPNIKSVGMLYDAKSKVGLKEEASEAAQKLGLKLVAKPISSKADVAGTLDELVSEADCLWAGVDTLVYNSQSAKHILLTTLRSKIPFMAFSSHYVDAGALMALECDYEDIGRQTAEMAIDILNGKNPGTLPIGLPRKVDLVTNQNTAEVIGVTIPQEFLN